MFVDKGVENGTLTALSSSSREDGKVSKSEIDDGSQLKDIEVNLNELRVLEDDFKAALKEYREYNYSHSFEKFLKVMEKSVKLKATEVEKKAIKYLAKLSILKRDHKGGLSYLRRLDVDPKTLNYLVRCLLVQYEDTRRAEVLYYAKEIIRIILSYRNREEASSDGLANDWEDKTNFIFKNNLMLLKVFRELGEYVPYCSLVDKLRRFLRENKKKVKNKHVISLCNITSCHEASLDHEPEESEAPQIAVVKELENEGYESDDDYSEELVGQLLNTLIEEEIELKIEARTVDEILKKLLEFYDKLEEEKREPFKENVILKVKEIEKKEDTADEVEVEAKEKRQLQTRQGQRDVKRRIIALDGVSTKSIYLKNYWSSICNFFYLNDFYKIINSKTLGSSSFREEEGDEEVVDMIYQSDIARYLRYSESYYTLKLMRKLGSKGNKKLSEKSSMSVLLGFLKELAERKMSSMDLSLKLLEFLLKNHQISNHLKHYQLVLSKIYEYVNVNLLNLSVNRGNELENRVKRSKEVVVNTLYKYNGLFESRNRHVLKFREINEKYGIRMLSILYKSSGGFEKSNQEGTSKTSGVKENTVSRVYQMCLFNMYKLCKRDEFKKIHILYFYIKKLKINKEEVSEYIFKAMDQYKYIMEYNGNLREGAEVESKGVEKRNMTMLRRRNRSLNRKLDRYVNTLFNNMGNFVKSESNMETQLDKFTKRFFVVMSSYVDMETIKKMCRSRDEDLEEEEINELNRMQTKYKSKGVNTQFYEEFQEFLIEAMRYIGEQEELPKWTESLLLLYGDVLAVLAFNLHKNVSNLQVKEVANFSNYLNFSLQFVTVLSSTLLVITNKLGEYKYTREIVELEVNEEGGGEGGSGKVGDKEEETGYVNCLKEIELVNGYSTVLNSVVARIYTNLVFIIYYLINYLMTDYSTQESKVVYYLYVTFSQVAVIILSSFFNLEIHTKKGNEMDIKLKVSYLLTVFKENKEREIDDEDKSGDKGEKVNEGEEDHDLGGFKELNNNVMMYYYTYNGILDSLLQTDLLFKENDMKVEESIIPKKLKEYIYVKTDGTEFADSPLNINLNLSTTIFNKMMKLFNEDFRQKFKKDLEIINSKNHLIQEEFIMVLERISQNLYSGKEYNIERGKASKNREMEKKDYFRKHFNPEKDISLMITEMCNKCINNIAGREFNSPVVAMVSIHFKKNESIENYIYQFKELFDKVSMPAVEGVCYFKVNPNPIIISNLSRDKKKENTSNEQNETVNQEGKELENDEGEKNKNKGESELSEGKDEREVKEVSENKEESVENKKEGGEAVSAVSEINGSVSASSNPNLKELEVESGSVPQVETKGVSSSTDEKKEDEEMSKEEERVAEYKRYVGRMEDILRSDKKFDYSESVKEYKKMPKYDFMETHKKLYVKIIKTFSAIDNIVTLDMESYKVEYLLQQMEIINLASIVVPRSYDVPFLAIVKNFELYLSLLENKEYNERYSFYNRENKDWGRSPNSGPSNAGTSEWNRGDISLEDIEKRILHLTYITLYNYRKLKLRSMNLVKNRQNGKVQIFFEEFDTFEYNEGEVDKEGSVSYKVNKRIKIMHFMRVIVVLNMLKRGELIPSILLFNDFYAVVDSMRVFMKVNKPQYGGDEMENFVAYSASNVKIYDSVNYQFMVYFQIKVFERIVKNVPVKPHIYTLAYAKILINYKEYIEILMKNKSLIQEEDAKEEESLTAPESVEEMDSKEQGEEKPMKTNNHNGDKGDDEIKMEVLNETFEGMYERSQMDDELIIVYYKMHSARLRLCYMNPKIYHITVPFSFSKKYNELFNTDKFKDLIKRKSYQEWALLVEYYCTLNNIGPQQVAEDVVDFFNKIKNSPDNDLGCMVCYKLACYYYGQGNLAKCVENLEEMTGKILIPNDWIRFAVNFEISFVKSLRKIVNNTTRMLVTLTCRAVQNSKVIQDQQTTRFKQTFYASFSENHYGNKKTKNKVKTPKKGNGNWIYSGIEKVESLENISRMVEVHCEMLQTINKKFKVLAEKDKNSLLFWTLNYGQNVVFNALTYCFMLLVYACPHTLSLSLMESVLDVEDMVAIVESQEIVKIKGNQEKVVVEAIYELMESKVEEKEVYEYLEKKKVFHHTSVSSEYNAQTATMDMRLLKQLFNLVNMKLYLKPAEITNKLSEVFLDACNRLLYMVPSEENVLNNAQDIELPSGKSVKISDEWASNQRITTIQKATSAFNEAINKQS